MFSCLFIYLLNIDVHGYHRPPLVGILFVWNSRTVTWTSTYTDKVVAEKKMGEISILGVLRLWIKWWFHVTEPCINRSTLGWQVHLMRTQAYRTQWGPLDKVVSHDAQFMQPRARFAGDVNTIMLQQGSGLAVSSSAQHEPVLVWVMSAFMETFQPLSTMRRIHVIMYQADCKSSRYMRLICSKCLCDVV